MGVGAELAELHAEDNKDDVGKTSQHKRQTWGSQVDFIMSAVGCAVGLGNIWRFPYLCYKNGGGAFLVPYLICFFFAAAPMFILEISLGQYTSSNHIRAWSIAPAFQGIGLASQVVLAWSNVYYIIVIAWALYYVAVSLTSVLPWSNCDNDWNSNRCYVTGMSVNNTAFANCSKIVHTSLQTNCTDDLKPVDSVAEFWEKQVLHISSGIEEPGSIVPGLAVSLLVAWVLVYLCICGGVKWTGKIVYFTATIPYLLLTVLLIRGVTLDGALDGVIFYLRPDFTRLGDAKVWIDGGTQVLYSIGIAQGFMVTMGSYNTFHTNSIRNGLFIISVNCLTSLYSGLAVFAILGFMAHEINVPIDKVVQSGPGLVFLAYPKAVTQMSLSPFWSALFFLMILFVGLDSEFVGVEGLLTSIMDRFPKVLYRPRNRAICVALYCGVSYVLGLTMVTEGGVYVFRLIDYYSVSGLTLLAIGFAEVVTIAWLFEADRFYDALELMVGRRYGPYLKFCWKFLSPLILLSIFMFELVKYKPLTYSDTYTYPLWATVLGFCVILSSTGLIPATFIYFFCKAKGTFKQRWVTITTPMLKKHQICPKWKAQGYRWTLVDYESHDVNNPSNTEDDESESLNV